MHLFHCDGEDFEMYSLQICSGKGSAYPSPEVKKRKKTVFRHFCCNTMELKRDCMCAQRTEQIFVNVDRL